MICLAEAIHPDCALVLQHMKAQEDSVPCGDRDRADVSSYFGLITFTPPVAQKNPSEQKAGRDQLCLTIFKSSTVSFEDFLSCELIPQTNSDERCPTAWDDIRCWYRAEVGRVVSVSCANVSQMFANNQEDSAAAESTASICGMLDVETDFQQQWK
ncbi:hypothetical protein EYF80_025862 [Liparis tanakae]|uniref:G-protein coupled receptors family 2 profile 1 domain-containing protein n=1 Tax=Liparis tanakae TaxID=230148 RepID=A0A4Z2HDK0_9TELE|nr:hypothetical protein EYF80_025862 [Liparis tanakae]